MKLTFRILIAASAVLQFGCTSMNHDAVAFKPETTVKSETFIWASPDSNTEIHEVQSPLLESIVRVSAISALKQKGLRPGTPGSADLIVTFHALQMPSSPGARFRDGPLGLGLYSGNFAERYYFSGNTFIFRVSQKPDPRPVRHSQRTTHILLIDILDARTGELVWRGWSQSGATHSVFMPRRVPGTVKRILNGVPLAGLD